MRFSTDSSVSQIRKSRETHAWRVLSHLNLDVDFPLWMWGYCVRYISYAWYADNYCAVIVVSSWPQVTLEYFTSWYDLDDFNNENRVEHTKEKLKKKREKVSDSNNDFEEAGRMQIIHIRGLFGKHESKSHCNRKNRSLSRFEQQAYRFQRREQATLEQISFLTLPPEFKLFCLTSGFVAIRKYRCIVHD